jgi:dihydropteroate synthase
VAASGAFSAQTIASERLRGPRCEIWGVLNVTPDSFSDGGRFYDQAAALEHAAAMLAEGADVIDVGGASSRPRGRLYGDGASEVPEAEELARVRPVVRAIVREFGARVSIDTTRASVARAALDEGASIINDVSLGVSPQLLDVAARYRVECVLMHTRGSGEVVPPNTDYADVVADVTAELMAAVERGCRHGIARDKLWIDPGLGFAKTAEQSLALLAHTRALVASGIRVLCGPSRKGFIAELAPRASGERPGPREREPGTLAAVTVAVLQGASAVRVHDVAATRQALLLADAVAACAGRGC